MWLRRYIRGLSYEIPFSFDALQSFRRGILVTKNATSFPIMNAWRWLPVLRNCAWSGEWVWGFGRCYIKSMFGGLLSEIEWKGQLRNCNCDDWGKTYLKQTSYICKILQYGYQTNTRLFVHSTYDKCQLIQPNWTVFENNYCVKELHVQPDLLTFESLLWYG